MDNEHKYSLEVAEKIFKDFKEMIENADDSIEEEFKDGSKRKKVCYTIKKGDRTIQFNFSMIEW